MLYKFSDLTFGSALAALLIAGIMGIIGRRVDAECVVQIVR